LPAEALAKAGGT